jgi:hypothetical protein
VCDAGYEPVPKEVGSKELIPCGFLAGKKMVGEATLRKYLDKFDRKYWATYKVLDILQKVFYRSNPAREAFVEMCASDYVQKMTFDSYLYKTVRSCPSFPAHAIRVWAPAEQEQHSHTAQAGSTDNRIIHENLTASWGFFYCLSTLCFTIASYTHILFLKSRVAVT